MTNTIIREPFVLRNPSGESIAGDLRYTKGGERNPVVILCHSFMAFKDWGWFPLVATKLSEAGFTAVSFNFSRNGVRENPDRITDFDMFQRNTISHELEDLSVVLRAVQEGTVGRRNMNPDQIALLGHSRGGGLAIITATKSRNIKALVTWSSVSTFDRWTQHQKEQWRKLGYLPQARDTAVSPLKLGLALLEDVEKNREKLDIMKAASRISIPWLLIHGTEDLLVQFSEGERLYAAANKPATEFVPLEKVGHLYDGAKANEESAIHRVMDTTMKWLNSKFF